VLKTRIAEMRRVLKICEKRHSFGYQGSVGPNSCEYAFLVAALVRMRPKRIGCLASIKGL
jgi:hypothetical protein